jgi:hypothetical protein
MLVLAAVSLSACETTAEKSARLEKIALEKQANLPLGAKGLKIATPSRNIQVVEAVALHSTEGAAVAVKLRNRSAKGQVQVPLLIHVSGAGGTSLYTNSTPGLALSLVSAGYIPPHGTVVWVNDQIQASAEPKHVQTTVGEGKPASGAVPKVQVKSWKIEHEPGGIALVAGTVANESKVPQHELVVTALAARGGHTVAAGRGVLTELEAGASNHFQIFLVGANPAGAKLTVAVSPSTVG